MENEIIGLMQLDRYDVGALNLPGMPTFSELVRDALSGRLDLSLNGLLNSFGNLIWGELVLNGLILRQLIIIAIMGALLSCLTDAFKNKAASETGFYVTYLMAVLLAISSFHISIGILTGLVSVINNIMTASTPLIIGLMTMGGNFFGAAAFHPLLFFALQLVTWFITGVFIPLVLASAALDIVGQVSSEGHKLENLAIMVRKIAEWSLKGLVALFAFLLTLQRFTAPIISNVALRTSRNIAGAVPVVGNVFSSAIDTVVYFSKAARSGVLVAIVLILCFVLISPILKMLVLSFVYKAAAAFMQPVVDPRLITLMDSIGKHMGMLCSAAVFLGVMCIYSVIILLSF